MISKEEKQIIDDYYKNLLSLYFDIKGVIYKAERERGAIGITHLSELRSAFDHINRAHYTAYFESDMSSEDLSGKTIFDYVKSNLDSAKAHLLRAGYDAYDALGMALIELVEKTLIIPRENLYKIQPDALNVIIQPFEKAKTILTNSKLEKDISLDFSADCYEQSKEAVSFLLSLKDLIEHIERENYLLSKSENKKRFKSLIDMAIVGIVVGIVVTFINPYTVVKVKLIFGKILSLFCKN